MNLQGIIGTVVADPSIFNTASPQAERIKSIGNGFLIAGSAMLLLVIILTICIVIRFRQKAGTPEPRQTSGNRKLEVFMVGVPVMLVIIFFTWSVNVVSAVMPVRGHHTPDIIITGHQWWWQADYTGDGLITANEIHLPVGRPLLFELRSADVIHDWWVPALGAKMDMIPGSPNYLWVSAQRVGVYEGTCSEFCGEQHAWMRIRVVVDSPGAYRQWVGDHHKAAVQPLDSTARFGQALFMHASCSGCHRIAGTPATGITGPDLTHFASRSTLLSGMMDNSPYNVQQWLTDPQKVKPGAHMPRFIFGKDSIKALTAYLSRLK